MTYGISRYKFVAVLVGRVLHILCDLAGLSDSHNSDLRAEDGWNEIGTSDVSNTRYAESGILEVSCRELALLRSISHAHDLRVNLENALILDTLNVRHSEPILGIDGNREVVILLNYILLYITVLVGFRVEV